MLNPFWAALKRVRLPLILLLVLLFPLLFGSLIPYNVKALLYSFSLSLKSALLFLLPFIIFSFIFSSLIHLKSGALQLIITLVGSIFISNCAAIFLGFTVGSFALPHLSIMPDATNPTLMLIPLWELKLPTLIPNQFALLGGFACGILFSLYRNNRAEKVAKTLHGAAIFFLKHLFTPLLPLFILGFVFKLEQEELLEKVLKSYGPVFFLVVGTQISYVLLLYFLAAKCSFKKWGTYLKNVLPATLTGLSTVSSAATMPVLILCTEKNLSKPEFAEIIIPASINTHTLGSAIGLTVLSLTTLLIFGHHLPSFPEFCHFAFYWALAKFAVAAVPGGAIIVATPLLEAYLHFSSEMIGLITAVYLLLDPFGTATNVTGNGFLPIAFSKLFKFKFSSQKSD